MDAKEFETALRHHDRVFELLIDGQKERALLKELLITVPRRDLEAYLETHEHYSGSWIQELMY